MVCLGNICRSPLAEGILASKLPLRHFSVDSAGTGHYHIGESPDERSIAIAKANGLDISLQIARKFSVQDFENFDYIYAMDGTNYQDILDLAPDEKSAQKVILILNELFEGENVDVPDPYYGLENGFPKLYDMLEQVCDTIAENLKKKHL
jgi:protein-tyrosine phosphatase